MNYIFSKLEKDIAKLNKKLTSLKLLQDILPDLEYDGVRLTSSKIKDFKIKPKSISRYGAINIELFKSFKTNNMSHKVFQKEYVYGINIINPTYEQSNYCYNIIDIEKEIENKFSEDLKIKIMEVYNTVLIKSVITTKTIKLSKKSFVPQKLQLLLNFT